MEIFNEEVVLTLHEIMKQERGAVIFDKALKLFFLS